MGIYTKTGDKGETSLATGERVAKDSPRIEAYGTVDELSSHIGLLMAIINHNENEKLNVELERVQNVLFEISSVLAGAEMNIDTHLEDEISAMEQRIDEMQRELPQLRAFILPGGCTAAAQCHVCRTVCRRAERRMVSMSISPLLLKYINRLSDYLFILARSINKNYGVEEKTWQNTCT